MGNHGFVPGGAFEVPSCEAVPVPRCRYDVRSGIVLLDRATNPAEGPRHDKHPPGKGSDIYIAAVGVARASCGKRNLELVSVRVVYLTLMLTWGCPIAQRDREQLLPCFHRRAGAMAHVEMRAW